MTRFHSTSDGQVPFTPEEESEWDAMEAAEAAKAGEMLMQSTITATQSRLDAWAKTRNYDGILSLCTYATSSVPKFAAEGQQGVNNRDQTWAALYTIMGEVEAGARPMPSCYADIEGDLPVLVWPS